MVLKGWFVRQMTNYTRHRMENSCYSCTDSWYCFQKDTTGSVARFEGGARRLRVETDRTMEIEMNWNGPVYGGRDRDGQMTDASLHVEGNSPRPRSHFSPLNDNTCSECP